jgi:hypothetical protein
MFAVTLVHVDVSFFPYLTIQEGRNGILRDVVLVKFTEIYLLFPVLYLQSEKSDRHFTKNRVRVFSRLGGNSEFIIQKNTSKKIGRES